MSKKTTLVTNDNVFHTLERKHPRLMLAVANEAHGTKFTGEEKVVLANDEHYLKNQRGEIRKTISDSHLIIGEDAERFHFECQSKPDGTMPRRMAEYGLEIALENGKLTGDTYQIILPRAAVIFVTHTKNTPETFEVILETENGNTVHEIHTIKIQNYTIDQLFSRQLFVLIPYHIWVYKNQFKVYNEDAEELKKIQKIYADIVNRLEEQVKRRTLGKDEYIDILDMSARLADKVTEKFENVRKAIGDIMQGELLELRSEQDYNEGRLEICVSLIKDGIISIVEAAKRLGMTEDELKAHM